MISPKNLVDTFEFKTEIHIRPAIAADLPLLEWYGQYTHFRRVLQRTFEDQQTGKRLMLLADLNNFPIGQIFLLLKVPPNRAHKPSGYLYSLRVLSHMQGMGIGTRLVSAAEEILTTRGFYSAIISATKDNVRARSLYERLGYRVFAEDAGKWNYENHLGETVYVQQPCWMLHKKLP